MWVLDALPGDVRAGAGPGRQDHPADLIAALQRITLPLPNRSHLQSLLTGQGFSPPIARWASTNLRPVNGDHRCGASGLGSSMPATVSMRHLYLAGRAWAAGQGRAGMQACSSCRQLTWSFDLPGIDALFRSYEQTDMWPFLGKPAQGITVGMADVQGVAWE